MAAAAPDPDGTRGRPRSRGALYRNGAARRLPARPSRPPQAVTRGGTVDQHVNLCRRVAGNRGNTNDAQRFLASVKRDPADAAAARRPLPSVHEGLAVRTSDRLNEAGRQADAYDQLAAGTASGPGQSGPQPGTGAALPGRQRPQGSAGHQPGRAAARPGQRRCAARRGGCGDRERRPRPGGPAGPRRAADEPETIRRPGSPPPTWRGPAGNNLRALQDLERARALRQQQIGGSDAGADFGGGDPSSNPSGGSSFGAMQSGSHDHARAECAAGPTRRRPTSLSPGAAPRCRIIRRCRRRRRPIWPAADGGAPGYAAPNLPADAGGRGAVSSDRRAIRAAAGAGRAIRRPGRSPTWRPASPAYQPSQYQPSQYQAGAVSAGAVSAGAIPAGAIPAGAVHGTVAACTVAISAGFRDAQPRRSPWAIRLPRRRRRLRRSRRKAIRRRRPTNVPPVLLPVGRPARMSMRPRRRPDMRLPSTSPRRPRAWRRPNPFRSGADATFGTTTEPTLTQDPVTAQIDRSIRRPAHGALRRPGRRACCCAAALAPAVSTRSPKPRVPAGGHVLARRGGGSCGFWRSRPS